jgi:hypothetical protein
LMESISMSSHLDIFYNINSLISYNSDSILRPHMNLIATPN